MPPRVRTVNGKPRVFIDFWYKSPSGNRRYRRDFNGRKKDAKIEERRLRTLLEQNGGVLPDEEPPDCPRPESRESDRPPVSEITFEEVVKHFRNTEYLRKKPNTQDGYDEILSSKHLSEWRDLPLSQIDSVAFGRLDARLSGLSASRRRNIHVLLRSVFRTAKEGGLISTLPPFPKLPRVGRTDAQVFPKECLPAVLQALPSPEMRSAVALAALAGLRSGEIRGLRWDDVELDDRQRLVVRRGLSTRKGQSAPPKSGHERIIPLPPSLAEILKEAKRHAHGEFVVANRAGRPVSYRRLLCALKQALKACGIKRSLGLHSLRHLFVTALFAKGVGAPVVQRLAGHSSLEVTQRYCHVGLDEMKEAVHRITLGVSGGLGNGLGNRGGT